MNNFYNLGLVFLYRDMIAGDTRNRLNVLLCTMNMYVIDKLVKISSVIVNPTLFRPQLSKRRNI